MKFNKLIPELTVSDIGKSKVFYTEVLGFKVEYERPEDKFAFLSLGEAQLMLDEINGNWNVGELKYPFGNGINFQIDIEDIEGFVKNVKAQGVPLLRDIFTSSYQCGDVEYEENEVLIQDPDGYLLRFSKKQKVKIYPNAAKSKTAIESQIT